MKNNDLRSRLLVMVTTALGAGVASVPGAAHGGTPVATSHAVDSVGDGASGAQPGHAGSVADSHEGECGSCAAPDLPVAKS